MLCKLLVLKEKDMDQMTGVTAFIMMSVLAMLGKIVASSAVIYFLWKIANRSS